MAPLVVTAAPLLLSGRLPKSTTLKVDVLFWLKLKSKNPPGLLSVLFMKLTDVVKVSEALASTASAANEVIVLPVKVPWKLDMSVELRLPVPSCIWSVIVLPVKVTKAFELARQILRNARRLLDHLGETGFPEYRDSELSSIHDAEAAIATVCDRVRLTRIARPATDIPSVSTSPKIPKSPNVTTINPNNQSSPSQHPDPVCNRYARPDEHESGGEQAKEEHKPTKTPHVSQSASRQQTADAIRQPFRVKVSAVSCAVHCLVFQVSGSCWA